MQRREEGRFESKELQPQEYHSGNLWGDLCHSGGRRRGAVFWRGLGARAGKSFGATVDGRIGDRSRHEREAQGSGSKRVGGLET